MENSNRDEDFDEFHSVLKSLKADAIKIKDLHWQWEDPKTKKEVNETFFKLAENILTCTIKIQNKLRLAPVDDIPKGTIRRSKTLRRSFSKGSQRRKALKGIKNSSESTQREFPTAKPDEFHNYLKSLKAEAIAIKDLHKIWGFQSSKESADKDFHTRAENITYFTNKLQERLGLLDHPDSYQQQGDPHFDRPIDYYQRGQDMNTRNSKRRRVDESPNDRQREQFTQASSSCPNCAQLKQELDDYKYKQKAVPQGESQIDLAEQLHKLERDLRERDEVIPRLYQEIESKKAEIQRLSYNTRSPERHLEQSDYTDRTIEKLKKELDAERRAKDDALRRLSASAGSRLRDNNPGITDLSDPNRPMKIAEQLSELYDNEWTTVLENISEAKGEYSEEAVVQLLLNILTDVYIQCEEAADIQLRDIFKQTAVPQIAISQVASQKLNLTKPSVEYTKATKDYRKTNWESAVPLLQQIMREKIKQKFGQQMSDICKIYIDCCTRLCWLMRIQDPPVHMEWTFHTGSPFDTNKFRTYTSGGNVLVYIVWPVLYLHQNGPLLSKGIAQGKKDTSIDGNPREKRSNYSREKNVPLSNEESHSRIEGRREDHYKAGTASQRQIGGYSRGGSTSQNKKNNFPSTSQGQMDTDYGRDCTTPSKQPSDGTFV